MKRMRCILILFLLTSFIHSGSLLVYAEDFGISTAFEEENGLLYSNGGTWIQAADGRWWYQHSDGSYTTSDWEYINGKWYYFDSEGWMVTGWKQLSGIWYYLKPESGEMVTNWQYIDNYWYYFNSSGAMQTGWLHDSNTNKDYYLNSSGQMVTGWQYLVRPNCYRKDSYGNDIAYYHYFDNSGMLVTDSDVHGSTTGFNTFQSYKNLTGSTLIYFCSCKQEHMSITYTAADTWNSANSCNVNLSAATSVYNADIRVYNSSSLPSDVNARTLLYYNNQQVTAGTSNWDVNIIYINSSKTLNPSTMVHEFGHALGLSHRITNKYSIMYYTAGRYVLTPKQCDIDVVNFLY